VRNGDADGKLVSKTMIDVQKLHHGMLIN